MPKFKQVIVRASIGGPVLKYENGQAISYPAGYLTIAWSAGALIYWFELYNETDGQLDGIELQREDALALLLATKAIG